MGLYRHDFRAWALEQADAALRRSANEIDWENLAEELKSLGSQVEWELYNRLRVLLTHLLKWRFQPGARSRSWRNTIRVQRKEIAKHLRQNPSLRTVEAKEFVEAYETARLEASAETKLAETVFPNECPFTLDQAKAEDFWPETD